MENLKNSKNDTMDSDTTPLKVLIGIILVPILAMITYELSVESLEKVEKNSKKKNTFLNYKIITVNKDTIKGDFYLCQEIGLFAKKDSYYINLKDSTRYNSENVVSISKIR